MKVIGFNSKTETYVIELHQVELARLTGEYYKMDKIKMGEVIDVSAMFLKLYNLEINQANITAACKHLAETIQTLQTANCIIKESL